MNKFFPYVVVELKGGIGNLLFQYIAGLKISKSLNARLVFTEKPIRNNINDKTNKRIDLLMHYLNKKLYETSNFELLLGANTNNISNDFFLNICKIFKKFNFYLGKDYLGGYYKPINGSISPIVSNPYKKIYSFFSIYLNGYYQHSSYYLDYLDDVLNDLQRSLFPKIEKNNLFEQTCIQIRRGDYVTSGFALSKKYYIESLKKIDPDKKYPVMVMSDEIFAVEAIEDYCKKNGYKINYNEVQNDPFVDFKLIARSKNIIMSNSTFCWWATSLGDKIFGSENKKVIYPKYWIKELPIYLKNDPWIEIDSF